MKHERKLMDAMRNRPFVLLGVNSDEDVELARRTAAEHEATWPSLSDQKKELANRWNVSGWPTTYVISDEGKIVVKADPRAPNFAPLIEKLVENAEAKSP